MNIFKWRTKLNKIIVDSTASRELIAAKMALKGVYKYTDLIEKIWGIEKVKYIHYTDNLPLVRIFEKKKIEEEPRMNGCVRYCIQCIQELKGKLIWISTKEMLADCLTKFLNVT